MKQFNEILAPSGNKDSFYAAISSGANAIYLGLDKFSARAYATNFSLDNLKEYVDYAHLRNVKIYVTMNTILYDEELFEAYSTVDKLAQLGVDAIIVQDLSLLNYIVNTYKSIEAHASTQMGIDDIFGAKLLKDLNVKRVVFARETPLNTIKEVKNKLNIEVESFVHGALCVAYSGNCLMSSFIGERSGNRGRCAGCCRQVYTLIDETNKEDIKQGYLLSMKDLNTSSYIKDMSFIDSYKIEGRMKEPSYVAGVTSTYRKLKDNEYIDTNSLNKVFNRTYTKGYLFNESVSNITNIERPNNYGYLIGEIAKINKNKVWIRLFSELNKGDQIRIESNNVFEEISVAVTKMFDPSFKVIYSSNKMVIIYLDKKVKLGAKVYKTKDVKYLEEINTTLNKKEYEKLPLFVEFIAKENKQLFLKIEYNNIKAYASSNNKIELAKTSSTTKENILNQLNKLNDTPYYIANYNIDIEDNLFIPLKEINELRRKCIEELNNKRLINKVILNNDNKIDIKPIEYNLLDKPTITFEVNTIEQYNLLKELGYKHIYYKNNIVRRNNERYIDNITDTNEILVGGYGAIEYYKNNKDIDIISDYSFNVTNYTNVALLSSLGVKRITLSLEINKDHINKLVDNYYLNYNTYPNLELIVYGNITLMHTRYCVLKRLNMCGKCKTNKYSLKDRYTSFPILFNDDCTTRILNSKTLNNIDLLDQIHGVNYYRVIFTNESKEDMLKIIKDIEDKLNNNLNTKSFNSDKDTHGHFIKHIL